MYIPLMYIPLMYVPLMYIKYISLLSFLALRQNGTGHRDAASGYGPLVSGRTAPSAIGQCLRRCPVNQRFA